MNRSAFLAEVVASSVDRWSARCWELNVAPSYGALVVAQGEQLPVRFFGLVAGVETGPLDAGRQLSAYQKTARELERDHPELSALLVTSLSCFAIGFYDDVQQVMCHQTPLQPPPLHTFVREATADEMRRFCASHDYVHLVAHRLLPAMLDELLLAFLTTSAQKNVLDAALYRTFIDTFAELCDQDYNRLRRFIAQSERLLQIS